MEVIEKIIKLLEDNKLKYELKEHLPSYTSEQSAKYRNEPLKIGAKALILKADKEFIMAVLSAEKKLDSKKLKLILQTKSLKFASTEDVKAITSCISGSIPPFGNLFSLKLFIDESLLENEYIAFNAGSLTKSIKMKLKDYLKITNHELNEFSQ